MEAIQQMIIDTLGPSGPLMVVGLLGVFLILATLPILLKREADPLDKLKAGNAAQTSDKDGKVKKLRTAGGKDKLEKYATFLEPQNADEYSAMQLKMLQRSSL